MVLSKSTPITAVSGRAGGCEPPEQCTQGVHTPLALPSSTGYAHRPLGRCLRAASVEGVQGPLDHLLRGQAVIAPGVFLVTGFVDEIIGRPDAHESGFLRRPIDHPLGDTAAQATQDAVLLD